MNPRQPLLVQKTRSYKVRTKPKTLNRILKTSVISSQTLSNNKYYDYHQRLSLLNLSKLNKKKSFEIYHSSPRSFISSPDKSKKLNHPLIQVQLNSQNTTTHLKSFSNVSHLPQDLHEKSQSSVPLTSQPFKRSWWKCSGPPPPNKSSYEILRPVPHSQSQNPKVIIDLDRQSALETYRNLLHSSCPQSILPTDQFSFKDACRKIWKEVSSTESCSEVLELQRLAIEEMICLTLETLNQSSHTQSNQHISQCLYFIAAGPYSHQIVSVLGLDPIKGWRNPVKEELRLKTLRMLLRLVRHLGMDLVRWWSLEQSSSEGLKSRDLAKVGLMLIVALSKEGSVWQALRLFWAMESLESSEEEQLYQSDFNPLSFAQRAATALTLVDALWSHKRVDVAGEILEKISVAEWLGPVYQRYLLSCLMVRGAQGEVLAVQMIGSAYKRVWENSINLDQRLSGRNKRTRGVYLQNPKIPIARAQIEALGTTGQIRAARDVFHETIKSVSPQLGVYSQLPDLYAEIMRAHLKADDPQSIATLLTDMCSLKDPHSLIQPDQRHYNILIQAYANRMDVEGCSATLDRMIRQEVLPDLHTFGNICLLYAHIGDPESVLTVIEAVIKGSWLSRSSKPSRVLWNILLDACVESGDWSRSARLLELLERDDKKKGEADTYTNGIVLKSLVLSGSPADEVLKNFSMMYNHQTGLRADSRSYTLILQSVCDAEMMDLAKAIFHEIKKSATREGGCYQRTCQRSVRPNVYMYGIMISAFLRTGKHELATSYFNEMRSFGIEPSLPIYSMLTSAYAFSAFLRSEGQQQGDDSSEVEAQENGISTARRMAERFRFEILKAREDLKGSLPNLEKVRAIEASEFGWRPSWGEIGIVPKRMAHSLLGPIIQGYVKSARPAKALEVFRELLSQLGPDLSELTGARLVDLDIYTMLLDGYRRANDPAGVIEIWRVIFRAAVNDKMEEKDPTEELLQKVLKLCQRQTVCSVSQNEEDEKRVERERMIQERRRQRRRGNKLCLPLSIYTDCLSKHGYHEEVARTWHQVQSFNFGFDAANWNELCVAMFRSGDHRMAWWIVELVFFGKSEDLKPEDNNLLDVEEDCWADVLGQTESSSIDLVVRGFEGTRLEGALKTDGPMRPPNRTSLRRLKRFDDEVATKFLVKNLLDWMKDPEAQEFELYESNDERQSSIKSRQSWGTQIDSMRIIRRKLGWRPYEKVLRMLHGSLWRECSDLVIKEYESLRKKNEQITDRDKVEKILIGLINKLIQKYEEKYPRTLIQVLNINQQLNHLYESINTDELDRKRFSRLNLRDFVIRVIRSTISRIQN
ncbi:hypothetical protein BY996DRAFT_6626798 [Phakopsora pachyrhizi]|uniref:Pentatricopeptide repeat-containing protein n=1 Tax=Phakopsora pachyrhizi TaxID=170000 RepID=A0AAV0AP11_PHAPC|nr:hypothetical protein BY996DRAFT_6626798 [Phakopsora pachyrhizi]CAH7668987.1 hypothetical protein PPACK8108_LOCUS3546 [Phakopsora pachyrhizi]